MSSSLQAIRGMNDILPQATPYWQYLEQQLRELVASYGYSEIRFPIVENTVLFTRGIGEATDIVEKEMYTFTDRSGDSLTLRPEGTACCVRACIEHGLVYNQVQRLWYMGPMFRHERPQKGRYRQFHQFGVEVFGIANPEIDAEILLMSARLWRLLGLHNDVALQLNSLGSKASRANYRAQLVQYFTQHSSLLDADSLRRLQLNPLRILDSKNPALQQLIADAPSLLDHLDDDSKLHFERLCYLLDKSGIHYQINPRLVRGLDYYGGTVFEWVTEKLGAQNAICSGGRYDQLVEMLGGKATPAIGFALGFERVIALLETVKSINKVPDAYLILVGQAAESAGLQLAEQLHDSLPELCLVVNCNGGNFKTQFKRADKSGAAVALILGDEEMATNKIGFKFLREDKPQQNLQFEELVDNLKVMRSLL